MSRIVAVVVVLTLAPAAVAQLGGAYTINPIAPTGGTNYATLADAVNDLLTQGVGAPCIFELFDDAGPYTAPMPFMTSNVGYTPSTAVLVLGQWAGASSANRVTFRAAAGESPVFDATGTGMGIFFAGADYVTIEGIEIMNAPFDGISMYSESQHGQVLVRSSVAAASTIAAPPGSSSTATCPVRRTPSSKTTSSGICRPRMPAGSTPWHGSGMCPAVGTTTRA